MSILPLSPKPSFKSLRSPKSLKPYKPPLNNNLFREEILLKRSRTLSTTTTVESSLVRLSSAPDITNVDKIMTSDLILPDLNGIKKMRSYSKKQSFKEDSNGSKYIELEFYKSPKKSDRPGNFAVFTVRPKV